MFVSKLLFCLSVLSASQIIFAVTERRCFDCVSIDSCESGLDFARKLRDGILPPESRKTILNAFCGFDERNRRTPKVCCSDFRMEPSSRFASPTPGENGVGTTDKPTDPIENHPNRRLLPTTCGDIEGSRIIGGEVAKLYEFPWMALISYNTANGPDFLCAGSIINSRYILTAAHCVIQGGRFKNIAGVRVGEFDYRTRTDCQGYFEDMICESKIQDLEVEQIIPHAGFMERQPVKADIALLRVKTAITMQNNVAPICLPVYSSLCNLNLAGKNGTVAGWGITEKRVVSSKLMKAVIPILTGDACNHYYNRYEYQSTSVMETSFCAGAKLKDTCQGDSGGPLMVESDYNGSIRLVEFGIVSFGPMQCGSTHPGVYTDVTKYMNWILDNMKE